MKKLKLEDLAVESFITTGSAPGQGTVRGHQEEAVDDLTTGDTGGESAEGECIGGSILITRRCTYLITLCVNMSCPICRA